MKTLLFLCLSLTAACLAFEQASPGRSFEFPRDHGSHPAFRTEWWYITGHLDAANGRRFGFQITFFRQAGDSPDQQLYLAHTALLDVETGRFMHEERLNREGWDAHAAVDHLDLRNGNWTLRMEDDVIHARATLRNEGLLKLALNPAKPLVFFGKDGVSRKGASDQAASHYLTFPRLQVRGQLRLDDSTHDVTGQAWMDHEISSSQLDEGQVGWDWASIQLNDGTEVMVYRMRRADGSSDPHGTTLAWIDKAGAVRHIGADAFTWTPGDPWTSRATGAAYPIRPVITAEGRTFRLVPLHENQELDGPITGLAYWEGACDVQDAEGRAIGRAFLELAGYSGDLGRHLKANVPVRK